MGICPSGLGMGLQNPLHRFESDSALHKRGDKMNKIVIIKENVKDFLLRFNKNYELNKNNKQFQRQIKLARELFNKNIPH